jgi:hypothetical protein
MRKPGFIRSEAEFEGLLKRLAVLVPIARQQRRDAWKQAERISDAKPLQCGGLKVWDATEFLKIDYRDPDTPEQTEIRSIGLAVGALGGADAISEIGWIMQERGLCRGNDIWSLWDGVAGHWL